MIFFVLKLPWPRRHTPGHPVSFFTIFHYPRRENIVSATLPWATPPTVMRPCSTPAVHAIARPMRACLRLHR